MAVEVDVDGLTPAQTARRQRVMDAAMELAAEGGYDAVQMRDVAERAGVALGTIYRYFASKDHLLAACQVAYSRRIRDEVARRPARGDDVAERVVDVLRRANRAMERRPSLAAALVTAISSPDPAVSDCQREVTEVMDALLSEAMPEVPDERRRRTVAVLSHVWFSTLLGWVNGWWPRSRVGDDLESAARLLLAERPVRD